MAKNMTYDSTENLRIQRVEHSARQRKRHSDGKKKTIQKIGPRTRHMIGKDRQKTK